MRLFASGLQKTLSQSVPVILNVFDVDEKRQQVDLTLRLSEETQYRARTVEINGVDEEARNGVATRLTPGGVFDGSVLGMPALAPELASKRSLSAGTQHSTIIRKFSGGWPQTREAN
jgi:hypothetical protein